MPARFPEKVAAYVGVGQVADMRDGERLSYEFARAEATRRNNRGALRELDRIGSPSRICSIDAHRDPGISVTTDPRLGSVFHVPDPMNDVVCRPAAASERNALEALQWRASLANEGDREALLANPDAIELPLHQIVAGQVFVAERAGVRLGFAAILPREDGATELDGLFVEPDVWKQGVGRLLVEHCAAVARAGGSAALHVVGNPQAEGFYQACGFVRVGTAQTRFGVALSLRLSL